jgi:hypothetical protein
VAQVEAVLEVLGQLELLVQQTQVEAVEQVVTKVRLLVFRLGQQAAQAS